MTEMKKPIDWAGLDLPAAVQRANESHQEYAEKERQRLGQGEKLEEWQVKRGLKERGVENNLPNALALSSSGDFRLQAKGIEMGRELPTDDLLQLLSFWEKNYRSILRRGSDSYYFEGWDSQIDIEEPYVAYKVNDIFAVAGEARINFVWIPKPTDPENVSLLIDDPGRRAGVSFRLDREGKVFDREGKPIKEQNDPTRPNGQMSLECGSVRMPGDLPNLNTLVGETVAIGSSFASAHDKREAGKPTSYYHSRASFSPGFGDAEFFAKLVEKISRAIEKRF